MATTKKTAAPKATTVKKKAAVKKAPVAKKAPAKKAPVAKKAPAKKASPANTGKIKVTAEQHHKMICEAAYYISLERTHETVSPTEDWLQAEAAINQICTING